MKYVTVIGRGCDIIECQFMKYVALTGKVAECESGESVGCLPADSVYEVQQCLNAIHVVPAESNNAILMLPIIYIRKTIGNLQ